MGKVITQIGGLLLTVFLAVAASSALAGSEEFCWQETYGRGAGAVPTACPGGQSDAGLCYQACPAGWTGVGPLCHQNCPPGYGSATAVDISCSKPGTYGRNAFVMIGNGPSDCAREAQGRGCEQFGLLLYPRPKPGYKCGDAGLVCTGVCPAGMPDHGLFCGKMQAQGRGVGTIPQCDSTKQYDAGLCYPGCGAGYTGVGPVCWGQCPATQPVRCGMGCATTEKACAENIEDQVMSVVEAVINVAETVGTAGASTVAKSAGAGFAKMGAKFTANVTKDTVKDVVIKVAKKAGKSVADNAAKAVAGAAWQSAQSGEFDPKQLAGFDPTGITSIVLAYAKPVCSAPPSGAPATATRPAGSQKMRASDTAYAKLKPPTGPVSGEDGCRPDEPCYAGLAAASKAPAIAAAPVGHPNVADLAVGANGTVWTLDKKGGIFQVTASGPKQIDGQANNIAVDPAGVPWVTNAAKSIFRRNGSTWTDMPGAAIDIAIGANGVVWVLGTDGTPHRWDGSKWVPLSGKGTRIAVDPQGNPWVVNAAQNIFRYVNGNWQQLPGAATDIAIANDGTAYVVGGGGQVYSLKPGASNWQAVAGAAGVRIGAGQSVHYTKK